LCETKIILLLNIYGMMVGGRTAAKESAARGKGA